MTGYLTRHRGLVPYLLLAPGLLWLLVFYVVPGFSMFMSSFWSGTLETGYEFSLSNISNYTAALERFQPQFVRSVLYGGAATVLTLAISYPLAYAIAFRGGRYKNLLLFLVVAPFFTSFLLRTISWKVILGDSGIVFGPLKDIGLLPEDFAVLQTPIAVISGITYNFLPFMTLPIYVSLEKVDFRLIEAAQDLYASRLGAFRRITLPLSLPGVFAGSLLTFIPAMGDYVNAELLGNTTTTMIGNVIQNQFLTQNNYPTASALSFLLMAGILIAVAVYARLLGTEELTLGGPVMAAPAMAMGKPRASAATRISRFLDRYLLLIYAGFAVLYLMLPIAVMALFSFNDPAGRSNFVWQGFSLDAWLRPFAVAGLGDAVFISLALAFGSTLIATTLGTLIALGLARYQFRGRGATNFFIFLPMATPEIVLGASLLTLFVSIGEPPLFPTGFLTILIAHVMFNISYVVVTVRARLAGFPTHLEEAAMDLGATPWTTFWKITFPLILPGVMAAALLAFSLSIDDFVITNFTGGTNEQTFPMFIYAKNRIGIPPQVNVIGTVIFAVAVGMVALSVVLGRRRQVSRDVQPADMFLNIHRDTKKAE